MKDSITKVLQNKRIRKLTIIGIWIVIWQLFSQKIQNEIFLPGPGSVMSSLASLGKTTGFWLSIAHSLYKIMIGFLLGFLFALIFGAISCKLFFVREFFAPMIILLKSIPVASFIILVLVWVNSSYLSIFISFIVTFPILYISVLEGYDHVNQELLEMTRVYRVNSLTRFRYLYSSEILPFVISSAKAAVGMCWKAGISGEIIGLPKYSIGEQLYLSKLYLDISDLFAWTFVIVLLCFVFEKLFFVILRFAKKKILS